MDGRRAASLGKGRLRASSSAAARLARTSSWSGSLANCNNTIANPNVPLTNRNNMDSLLSNQQQGNEMVDDSLRTSRVSRASMRQMVRFRIPLTATDPRDRPLVSSGSLTNEETNNASGHLCNNESGGDERSTSVRLLWRPSEGETTAVQSPTVSCLTNSEVTTRTDSRYSRDVNSETDRIQFSSLSNEPDSNCRGTLVHQVSRFSVMQTVIEDPLQSTLSMSSSVSNDNNNNARNNRRQRGRNGRNRDSRRSRTRRNRSNNNPSSASGSRSSTPEASTVRSPRRRRHQEENVDPEEESRRNKIGIWPHKMSSLFALLASTVGLFNVSRFAVLTTQYGGNFILQFILLSFLFGIPMLCFHGCLGQFLGSGVIDMWRISPIFKGVGISLLIAQAIEGIYSIVGVAWMFFYFRDSFIPQEDRYKWSKCYDQFRGCVPPTNFTFSLEETIPDYFHGRVLQRSSPTNPPLSFISLKFEIAFNLAVIWMIIFVALGKGLRSYGKVVYAFGILPILGYFIVCVKLLGISSSFPNIYGDGGVLDRTLWNKFFTDTKGWVVAAREVFLTWGIGGAIVMQVASHNRYHHSLKRDIAIVIIATLLVLLLSGFLASACLQIINAHGFDYVFSSYETDKSYRFLKNNRLNRLSQSWVDKSDDIHNNFILGIAVRDKAVDYATQSGYQPIRLATEIFPAVMSVVGPLELSPFWAVLFYFSLVTFGIAHQLAIWHCVINGIVAFRACCLKSWETTITFCTCALGFLFSLPMATELGISIVYLLDYAVGSSWWLMIIYVIQIAAVLIVRGRPYNSESIVAVLVKGSGCMSNWCNPLLTFSWSVVLPIGLMVLSISSFKTGNFRDMFTWDPEEGYVLWPIWARQSGTMVQLVPLLLIPIAGVFQSIRYLSRGPSDLFERMKLLYRPHFRTYIIRPQQTNQPNNARRQGRHRRSARSRSRSRSPSPLPLSYTDPPPKYTPPPTYNTATGARIAKLFRESIRRSIRQIREMTTPVHSPGNTVTSMADLELGTRGDQLPAISQCTLPPPYTSVTMEALDHRSGPNVAETVTERLSQLQECESAEATTSSSTSAASGSHLTAAEVTRLLRESFRRSARQTIRSSLRLLRGKKSQSETSEDETTDTEGGRNLVHGAVRIHRDPSQSTIVVAHPNACGNSESIA